MLPDSMAQKVGTSKTVFRQLWDAYKFMFWAYKSTYIKLFRFLQVIQVIKGSIVAHCTGVMRMQWPMQGCSSAAAIQTIDRREPVGSNPAHRMQELS